MPQQVVEMMVGGLVVVIAALSIIIAYRSSGIAVVEGYTVTATFDRVEGIRIGSDVRLSGIKIGTVVAQKLEPRHYHAVLTLSVRQDIRLPVDTSAKIETEGLVGGRYVDLEPGAEEKMLQDGGQITRTQSSINLDDLLRRYLFGGAKQQGGRSGTDSQKGGR